MNGNGPSTRAAPHLPLHHLSGLLTAACVPDAKKSEIGRIAWKSRRTAMIVDDDVCYISRFVREEATLSRSKGQGGLRSSSSRV